MRYKVTRHPLVRDDLSTMTIFIGEYAGYDIAEKKMADIEASLYSLRDFPHVGTVRDEIYPGLRIIRRLARPSYVSRSLPTAARSM